MKANVEYDLDIDVRREIIRVRDCISRHIENSDIYLFGSISKGMYSNRSDIDILILNDSDKSIKELRILRHFIEDEIGRLRLEREVDIKLYTKERFYDVASTPSFEKAILNDLIDIRSW